MTHSPTSSQPADLHPSSRSGDTDVDLSTSAGSESSEDPHSPGPEPFAFLAGSFIALLTALVPLATVVGGRAAPQGPPNIHGSPPPAGIPSVRAAEPAASVPGGAESGEQQ